MLNHQLTATLLLLLGSAVATPFDVVERAACNRDNLFRCFIDQRSSTQASAYCSGLTPFTTTVATVTATETATVWTDVVAATDTETITSTTTVFTATLPSATVTVTKFHGELRKRQEGSAPPPKCMTNGVTYPASRITSACSCISVPVQTSSITFTAGTQTVTDTQTSLITESATTTIWETVSTDTTNGVATTTVAATSPTNWNFEQGNLNGWSYYDNDDAAYDGDVVSVPGPNGQPTWAFRSINKKNQGFAQVTFNNQWVSLKSGPRYRISFSGKTSVSGAGNTMPNTGIMVTGRPNWSIGASFGYPMLNGVALGNGWYRFSGEFTVPAQYQGDCRITFGFNRNANYVEHFVDDIAVDVV